MLRNKLLIFLSIAVILIVFIPLNLNSRRDNKKINIDQASLVPNLYDTSWLASNTCELGCWKGLTPWKTSRMEAITTVENLSFVNKDNLSINDTSLYFFCNPPMNEIGCGTLIFEGDLLQDVILFPNYLITMDQAVEKLGTPDGYSCYPTDPGSTGYQLLIYYTKKQLILVYREYRKDLLLGWKKMSAIK